MGLKIVKRPAAQIKAEREAARKQKAAALKRKKVREGKQPMNLSGIKTGYKNVKKKVMFK